jgi:DNA-binding PadR family transcriptional regulator
MHPYEIRQKMHERHVDRLIKITTGSLYHAVEKLAADRLIEVVETSREGRRPERTTYRLTGLGHDAVVHHATSLVADLGTEYPQFAMGAAFLHTLSPADGLEALRRRAVELRKQVAAERVLTDELTTIAIEPLFWLDLEYREVMYRAELTWVEDLIRRIEDGRLSWPDKVLRRQAELAEEYE